MISKVRVSGKLPPELDSKELSAVRLVDSPGAGNRGEPNTLFAAKVSEKSGSLQLVMMVPGVALSLALHAVTMPPVFGSLTVSISVACAGAARPRAASTSPPATRYRLVVAEERGTA